MKKYNIVVVGATGVVGRETLDILASRNFPYGSVSAVASEHSLGKKASFGDRNLHIDLLEDIAWHNTHLVFACAGSKVSAQISAKLPKSCVMIDKTSLYRLDKQVPLVVPELNAEDIKLYTNKNIIANPNCCVIPLAIVLGALKSFSKIKRVVISTYQSMSGAGKNAMEQLYEQTKNKFVYLSRSEDEDEDEDEHDLQERVGNSVAFNINPQIGPLLDNNYTDEEQKIISELGRILGEEIAITVTSVRVPVFIGHCFAVNVEFEEGADLAKAEQILQQAQGIVLSSKVITPAAVSGSDDVFVCRLRLDSSCSNAINFWVASDNLRKGAALNAVQIAENLIPLL
jgi:aspartate-semialdehyde dehydrogenase